MNNTEMGNASSKKICITNLLTQKYKETWHLKELQREFARKDFVKLPKLLAPEAFSLMKNELNNLQQLAAQRNFVMEGLETPRIMSVIGGTKILDQSPILWSLYIHYDLRVLIRNIVGAEIYPCLHPNEFMVANYLLASRSTHGWHLDDPAYALILVFDAPPPDDGGLVEFIPEWREFCDSMGVPYEEKVGELVEHARKKNMIRRKHIAAGDAYLLRADECLHQVTSLRNDNARRVVLNLGFEATPHPTYGHTASTLYGDD